MGHDTKWKIVYVSKLLIPIIVVVILFISGIYAGVVTFEPPKKNIEGEITATLTVYFNNETIYSKSIKAPVNTTVYDLLLKAAEIMK